MKRKAWFWSGAVVGVLGTLLLAYIFIIQSDSESSSSPKVQAQGPTFTPTPEAVVSVPVMSDGWQIVVESVEQTDSVSSGSFDGGSISVSTTQAGEGSTFIVVNVQRQRGIDNTEPVGFSSEDAVLVSSDGTRFTVASDLSESLKYVYRLSDEEADQSFTLEIADLPPIQLSVDAEPISEDYSPVISEEIGALPASCTLDGVTSIGDGGRLSLNRESEGGIMLGFMDGDELTTICQDVAWGSVQFADNGAALIVVYPPLGWSSLYLLEGDGTVYPLVNNGVNINARFDPTGQRVFFAVDVETENEEGDTVIHQDLYEYDRESNTLSKIHSGQRMRFTFLADDRLVVSYRDNSDDDQHFIEAIDGDRFEEIVLSEDVTNIAEFLPDGNRIAYDELDFASRVVRLKIANMDETNSVELGSSSYLTIPYTISDDSRFILALLGDGRANPHVSLYDIESTEEWTIANTNSGATMRFSSDSQWAAVVTDDDTLYIVSTIDGNVAHELQHVVNVYFAPDSSRVVYTVMDGSPEMFVLSLSDGGTKSLGSGVVTGWYGD